MGGTTYSYNSAIASRDLSGTYTNSIDDNFLQNKVGRVHESMKSQGVTLREARDSDVHPETFPIILTLDLTGSMQDIPQNLIKTGLPELMSKIINAGLKSPALLFLGVGDHECDRAPLQIGQFESGDTELDMWLQRTWLEGNGGGNAGESYSLAHYFAARCCVTDAWEKRKVKGVLITIGDEPNLKNYPSKAMKEITGNGDIKTFTDTEILAEAQEQWEVFHINPRTRNYDTRTNDYWQQLLGDRYIKAQDYSMIPDIVADIILGISGKSKNSGKKVSSKKQETSTEEVSDSKVML